MMKTRILTLSMTLVMLTYGQLTRAQESQTHEVTTPSLWLNIATESASQTKMTVEIHTDKIPRAVVKKMDGVLIGSTSVPLVGVADGLYYVYLFSPGYATQWRALMLTQAKVEPAAISVTLFRKRYVVLRYVFNASGGREFFGKDIKEGRAVVGHWGSLPYFQHDWQIWQKSSGGMMFGDDGYGEMFGDTVFLDFHRYCKGFGFAKVPEGISFDDLKEAPEQAKYRCKSTKAKKGLILFCRVQADRKEGLGYGKIVIEDVTETPPLGITLIETP